MSIYNLPPLKQTPEKMTGEVTDARNHLGRESARRALVTDDLTAETDGRILYFPTHESLQEGINHIREVVLAEVDARLQEVEDKTVGIDRELIIQRDRLRAIQGYIDDLGFSGTPDMATRQFNGYSYSDVTRIIQALEEVRVSLLQVGCGIKEERTATLAEIEAIEQKDFELLQVGK